MLAAILGSNPHSDFLYVVDTRPKVRCVYVCVCASSACVFRCVFKPPQLDSNNKSFRNTRRRCVTGPAPFFSPPPLPQLNAFANRAAGKGYENEDNYSNIKFQFIGIENIHVMRNSQQKMLEGNPPPKPPPHQRVLAVTP